MSVLYNKIPEFRDNFKALRDELHIYTETLYSKLKTSDDLEIFWTSLSERLPTFSMIELYLIWTPTLSVQCKQSFSSQYKNLLTNIHYIYIHH